MTTRSKRFRTGRAVPVGRPSRVDKRLIGIVKSPLGTTQLATVLITATFPCTITGIRWDLDFLNILTTGSPSFNWAIVRVKDGVTVSVMAVSDAGTFYSPEQELIAFGIAHVADGDGTVGPMIKHFSGSTKSMRKLMGGDTLQFICDADSAAAVNVKGIIQFFCRT